MGSSASFAAAAAAYLLAQQQSKVLTTNSGTFLPQFAFPLLYHSPTSTVANNPNLYGGLAHQPPNSSLTNIGQIGQPQSSPCPTPAYHYQLAAPKPIQAPINFGHIADHLLSMANHRPSTGIGFGGEVDGLKEATSTIREEENVGGKKQGEKEEHQKEKQTEGLGAIIKSNSSSRKNSNEKKEASKMRRNI
jgi:hypothetical protein